MYTSVYAFSLEFPPDRFGNPNMRDDLSHERLVADLQQAHDAAQITASPSQREVSFDLDSGYQVGHVLHERLSKRGYQSIGRKIGFTNRTLWDQFKVSQPVWAHMYVQTVHFAQEGYLRLPLDGMVASRLEPEVVLKLRRAVPSGDPSVEELARCLDWVAIGFEIVDSHYADWRFPPPRMPSPTSAFTRLSWSEVRGTWSRNFPST